MYIKSVYVGKKMFGENRPQSAIQSGNVVSFMLCFIIKNNLFLFPPVFGRGTTNNCHFKVATFLPLRISIQASRVYVPYVERASASVESRLTTNSAIPIVNA